MSDQVEPAQSDLPKAAAGLIPMIKDNGEPFSAGDLDRAREALAALDRDQRHSARNANANAIASHPARRMLVVSGPGTGKSTLFIKRLHHWLTAHPEYQVAVATFVRKLVADLNEDITNDSTISADNKKRVSVQTLHRMARSIVERNNGTKEFPLRQYSRIVSPPDWEERLWGDAVLLHPDLKPADYQWSEMAASLFDAEPRTEAPWAAIRKSHQSLQRLYNALPFPDLILVAAQAVRERADLVANTLFIIDEFQDFNIAERNLIAALTSESPGLLLVGDDDQVLYDGLRRAHAGIIREYYQDHDFVKGMLPYCSRCSVHICQAAAAFLSADRQPEAIDKLFIPIKDPTDTRVVVAVSTTPTTGVSYVERFVIDHKDELEDRAKAIHERTAKDPYLLVLTPSRQMKFLNVDGARQRLLDALAPYTAAEDALGEDYWVVRDYYYLASNPSQNYSMRKVFHHEGVPQDRIAPLLERAIGEETDFIALGGDVVAACVSKSKQVHEVIEAGGRGVELAGQLQKVIPVSNPDQLARDLDRAPLAKADPDDESPEFEQGTGITPVQIATIVGAKGLSADHVIVLGCDDTNLKWVTRNAFFVALTRARDSLTLMACMGGGGASSLHDFVCSLPDANIRAVYLKASSQEEYPTVASLQKHLGGWSYAKKLARDRRSKR